MHKILVLRGSHRIVVPVQLCSHMVHLGHESHQGIVHTKQTLRDLHWWPKRDVLVQSIIATCVFCQWNNKTARTSPAPMTLVPLPDGPQWNWTLLAHSRLLLMFAITIQDYYSKWPELCFAPQWATVTVIHFMRTVFGQKENPMVVITDNGPQFTSSDLSSFLGEMRYSTHQDHNPSPRRKQGCREAKLGC